jgi:signal transduction histidine kinase
MRKRLILSMVGLVLAVLLAHDIPLASHLSKIERDRTVTAIERDAFTYGARLSPILSTNSLNLNSQIQSILEDYSKQSDGIVVVIDSKGYLLASNDPTVTIGSDYVTRPEIATALLGDATSGTRMSNSIGGELAYVAVPIFSGPNVVGVLRITFPQSVLDADVNSRLRGVLMSAVISVLMAIVVAVIFARGVARPLIKLREATDELAKGNLSITAKEEGPRETKQLANSFNSMAQRLGGLIQRQRAFAGDASHQLRTPLTSLRLRLEQASDQVEVSPEIAQEHIDAALAEADRLGKLVEQLLHLARTEGAVLEKERINISDLVEDKASEWHYLAAERNIIIKSEKKPSLFARCNALALSEIIDNYMDNALEVAPEGSTISILAAEVSSQIEIIVRDEGRGLTSEQRQRAFDRFWRNSLDSNRRQGSGLGLAIVAQLAQAGGISVELRESPKGGVDAVLVIPGTN